MTNAKFYRNIVCAGLGALALSHVSLSHSAYAQLSAPVGWSPGAGAAASYNTAKTASQVASVELGRIAANAALTVNGKSVSIPAKLPLGPTAARVAAAAIYLHPGLRTIAAVAAWTGAAGLVYDVATGLWQKGDEAFPVSDGSQYQNPVTGVWHSTSFDACEAYRAGAFPNASLNSSDAGTCVFYTGASYQTRYISSRSASSCPSGWYVTPGGCVQTQPMRDISQPEFEQMLPDARPMPPELPGVVWPASWPVKAPEIQPMFVPTGNPVPNPNYDPAKPQTPSNQPYNQPGVRVVPAPTVDSPWQVDLQPVDRPVDSPVAKPNPAAEVNPDGTPKPDQGDKPKEDEDTRDLCEKNPDILACQKIDTEVEDSEIPRVQKTVSYSAESIWGFGSCPADQFARVGGQQVMVQNWQRDCQMITDYVRPVTLLVAALVVAGILAGALKS